MGRLRKAAKLTQEQLAERVEVSSFQVVSDWERGVKKPARVRIIRLIEIFAAELGTPEEARRWALQANHELTLIELQRIFPDYAGLSAQPLIVKPLQHPSLPDHYIRRPDIEQDIFNQLILNSRQVMVLTGAGGMGKSTLAAWAADELVGHFRDGVVWLECQAAQGVADLQGQIARSFGVVLAGHSLEERAGELRSLLREKQCLLVLDDVWPDPELTHLKVYTETSPMLITGRDKTIGQPFAATTLIEVQGFGLAEGREFFEGRWAGDMSEEQLNELIGKVEGLPLALTLIIALLQIGHTAADLLTELERDKPDLAAFDVGSSPDRLTSIRRCFDLSYDRLPSSDLKQRFAQLACFARIFDLMAAAQVWGSSQTAARQQLFQLLRFNLISRQAQGYRLHTLLKEYTRQKLAAEGTTFEQATRRRHAAYFIRHALYHPHLLQQEADDAVKIDLWWADIVAAVSWASEQAPTLAAQAALMAYTERAALLVDVGPALPKAIGSYAADLDDWAERAVLNELLGDLYLLGQNFEAGLDCFARASKSWLAQDQHLAGSQATLRVAGVYLLCQEREKAAEAAAKAQRLFQQSLPLANDDVDAAQRLFLLV